MIRDSQANAGLGLRKEHFASFLERPSSVQMLGWVEIISEDYMDSGGAPLSRVLALRQNGFEVASHGVSLNIGGPGPIRFDYLKRLKEFEKRVGCFIVSDHLCWTGTQVRNWHDLFPLPFTSEMVRHVSERIKIVQNDLGRRIALENISTYLRFDEDEMSEEEFTAAILREADCDLLLDVNNLYVNSFNHNFDAHKFLRALPRDRVVQYHLAGHTDRGNFYFDTHDTPIVDPVWSLFASALEIIGPRPYMIERDDNIPPLEELLSELSIAKEIYDKAQAQQPSKVRAF